MFEENERADWLAQNLDSAFDIAKAQAKTIADFERAVKALPVIVEKLRDEYLPNSSAVQARKLAVVIGLAIRELQAGSAQGPNNEQDQQQRANPAGPIPEPMKTHPEVTQENQQHENHGNDSKEAHRPEARHPSEDTPLDPDGFCDFVGSRKP